MEFVYPVQSATVVGFRIRGDGFTADGDWLEIAPYVIAVNLTEAFGDGVEPTTEDFKTILSKYPNSWFDGTVNNLFDFKDMYKDYNDKISGIQQKYEQRFVAEYTTVKLECELTDTSNNNLSLISKKTVQEATVKEGEIMKIGEEIENLKATNALTKQQEKSLAISTMQSVLTQEMQRAVMRGELKVQQAQINKMAMDIALGFEDIAIKKDTNDINQIFNNWKMQYPSLNDWAGGGLQKIEQGIKDLTNKIF